MKKTKMSEYSGILLEAYEAGYYYAFYGDDEDYGFGENSGEEDLKHVPPCPKNINPEEYISAWLHGNAIGCEE